ncbi:MAG TPA: efflux RND transporter permease subunit, partial [Usitatibacter sp.]|nr:efflux RND transporter permease subunit [Usitatibacter sp.]
LIVVLAVAGLFYFVPRSFIPPEDQGYLISSILLPDGASLQRTQKTGAQFQKILEKDPSIAHAFVAAGRDFIGGGNKPNAGTSFILLKDWDERTRTASQIAADLTRQAMQFPDGIAFVFNPPAIRGLGSAGGFEFYVQSRTDSDPKRLGAAVQGLTAALQKDPKLTGINTFFRPTVPQMRVEVNREQAISLGVPVSDVFDALQATFGVLYVNDFNMAGRAYRVQVQSEGQSRANPDQIGNTYVRSTTTGEMVPIRALITTNTSVGPEQVDRFNGFLAAKVLGSGKPGVSSGQAIAAVERVAAKALPAGYTLSWSGQAFQEKRTGKQSILAFGLAILMVYLILSA